MQKRTMHKRIRRIAASGVAVLFITGLMGLAGCGGKTEDPAKSDPNYYTGKDYKKGAPTTKGADN